MSRISNIISRIISNRSDKDLFKTLLYTQDGCPIFEIERVKDTETGEIGFLFKIDGLINPYATQSDVQTAIARLGTLLKFCGTKSTYSQLPATGNNQGDVWYVSDSGAEYVWIIDNETGAWEELGPIIQDPISENYTISSWTALLDSSPYNYQAAVVATYEIGNNTDVELINNQAVLFANYGFAIGSISGQNVTIYSIGEPSSNVTLEVRYHG